MSRVTWLSLCPTREPQWTTRLRISDTNTPGSNARAGKHSAVSHQGGLILKTNKGTSVVHGRGWGLYPMHNVISILQGPFLLLLSDGVLFCRLMFRPNPRIQQNALTAVELCAHCTN